jgi:uncharacterized protein
MELTAANILLSTLFVSIGSVVQAATGLGGGLIIVPLLAMISLDLVPGSMIFGSLALSASMAFYGRKEIEFTNMKPVLGGVLIGSIVAASFISVLPLEKLGVVFGILILLMVILSIKTPNVPHTFNGSLVAGTFSGFLGTSAGVGAPILALLYQHYSGPSLRATLAFLYFLSSVTMLIFLHLAGRFGVDELVSGLMLVPGFALGYLASPKLARLIDKGLARSAVLTLSTLSALVLIWRSVVALNV